MTSAGRARLFRALLTPQVIVAALLLVAAVALLLGVDVLEPREPPTVDLVTTEETLTAVDVRLVLVDLAGLEWQRSARISAPESVPGRLEAVLGALRESLMEEGVWPAGLAAPTVFLETFDRASVAIIDLHPGDDVAVSVVQEMALLRALTGTAQANGADEVRFLRDGRATATLLGHVAVPSSL